MIAMSYSIVSEKRRRTLLVLLFVCTLILTGVLIGATGSIDRSANRDSVPGRIVSATGSKMPSSARGPRASQRGASDSSFFPASMLGRNLPFTPSTPTSALDGFDPNANRAVRVVVVQPDGKILIGGDFTTLSPNGGAAVTRNHIARLNPDGTLDTAFDPDASNPVYAIAVQANGMILVGGGFGSIGGQSHQQIARLNPDGTLDTDFNAHADGDQVNAIAVQADGKILVGGDFSHLSSNGEFSAGHCIARLNANGTLDTTFNANANRNVGAIAVQAGGKILVGGGFTGINGQPRNHIARLNLDGTADSFNPNANGDVSSIAVQADGRVLVGGYFSGANSIGGQTRNCIARLDATTGQADSFDPNANSGVNAIVVQADGRVLVGGYFSGANSIGGQTRNFIARLNSDGTADEFNPNANNTVYAVAVQADGKVLVGGAFTELAPNGGAPVTRNHIARLETDGRLDQTLDNLSIVGSVVLATAVQPDGKILIGGEFTSVLGVPRNNIARLNTDGTLDTAFDPNAIGGKVYAIAVQADGRVLAGGRFTSIGGQACSYLARLDATTGLVDPLDPFDPKVDNFVYAITVQADGNILVGGNFMMLSPNGSGTVTRHRIARLHPNGTLDSGFDPDVSSLDPEAISPVTSIAVQENGQILLGGYFTTLAPNGSAPVARNRIARLNADGTLDTAFDPNANGRVYSIAVQADGKILVGGAFTGEFSIGGETRNHIARLNTDGTADEFNPNADNDVTSIAVQADGKILVGGVFNSIGGQTRNYIARLDATGAADEFNPNANWRVWSIAVQADGRVLAAGDFTNIGGQTRNLFARLSNDTVALQDLAVTQTTITWTRGGSSPELWRATFELSTDGVNYAFLGAGQRVGTSSNWTLTGLSLSTEQNNYIRARGDYRSGYQNGSESIVESVRNGFPAVPPPSPTPTPTPTPTPSPTPITCAPPPANMVGWWAFDGNANDIQGSSPALLFGSPSFVAGKVGQSLSFDGLDDHAKVPAATALDVGNGTGLTFDLWINPAEISTARPVIEWNDGAVVEGVHLWMSADFGEGGQGPGSLFVNLKDTSGTHHIFSSAPGVLAANVWQHVAVTYDKTSGVAKIYLNGTIVAQQTLGTNFTPQTATDLYLGYRPVGTLGGRRFLGNMDEVELFNRALDLTEIQSIYVADSAGNCKPAPTPAVIDITEHITVNDAPTLLPSAMIGVNERISVLDTPTLLPSAMIGVEEKINVLDAPTLLPSAMIGVEEKIRVLDTPTLLPSAMIGVEERILVHDTPRLGAQVLTGTGTNVTVQANGVTITFTNVTSAGITTITPIDPGSAGQLPGGYTLSGSSLAFDVTTTATFSGPITICFTVPSVTDLAAFLKLKVLHNENGTLVDRTSSHDFPTKTICAVVNSLSPFVIAEAVTPSAAPANISGRVTTSDGAPVAGVTIRLSSSQSTETITGIDGSYRFDNVETNGFYTITPSLANYTFSPPNRSFSLLGVHTEASFTATASGDQTNAIDTIEFFVRQQYLDFLGREPDPPGFNGWVNTIRNCAAGDTSCDRVHVSAAFYQSLEFQQRGYFVYRFYSAGFGRKPDFAEFMPDLACVSGFLTSDQLEAAKVAFTNDFTSRPAFVAAYNSLSNAAYVNTLLATAGVTLANQRALIDSLNAGTQTRAQVLRQIAESGEVYQKYYNQAFVVMEYFGYLRRDPDALYLNWIQELDQTGDPRHMVGGFVNSTEYRQRFGP